MTDDSRFNFGENWQNFVDSIDDTRIQAATNALSDLIGVDSLENESFLDAGCGSGIVTLAALILGAKSVHSFDYDPASVAATRALLSNNEIERLLTVEQGSLTDSIYLGQLGQFDTVYSWGVIHHTGAMWSVADLLTSLVKPNGRLVVAIYNDQKLLSSIWRVIKKFYVSSPSPIQKLLTVGYLVPTQIISNIKSLVLTRKLRRRRPRGMSVWHDAVDWVGGYPFEVASRSEVTKFFESKGFTTERVISVGIKQGCNQFVFRREPSTF